MTITDSPTASPDTDKPREWKLLFDLLAEIKAKRKFGKLVAAKRMPDGNLSLPFWLEDETVSKFFNTVYLLGIVVPFDWASWQDGMDILNDASTDFSRYDLNTLCKLITVIIRGDKFCEGYMINSFETGTVALIIEAMQEKVEIEQARVIA